MVLICRQVQGVLTSNKNAGKVQIEGGNDYEVLGPINLKRFGGF